MEVINQEDWFVEFIYNNGFKQGTYNQMKLKLIHLFSEVMIRPGAYNDLDFTYEGNPPFYLTDYMLIKRKIFSYEFETTKHYSYPTVGIVFHIIFMGNITKVDKALTHLKGIVDNAHQTHKNKLDRVEIYVSAPLNEYNVHSED